MIRVREDLGSEVRSESPVEGETGVHTKIRMISRHETIDRLSRPRGNSSVSYKHSRDLSSSRGDGEWINGPAGYYIA